MPGPQNLDRCSLGEGRFIRLDRIAWRDAGGTERAWESADRVGGLGAVLMIPILEPSRRLVLIRQYRPPMAGYVVEFPAGIVDKDGESPEETALRELTEETGYAGRILRGTPPTCSSPGLTSESVRQYVVEIDESRPANRNPQPSPDGGEEIEVLTVPLERLDAFIEEEFAAGRTVDSKVVTFALSRNIP